MAENSSQQFDRVCQAMADPELYPHSVEKIETVQTNISVVFLTGDWLYKIKKPMQLGFLDFSSLRKREHFCQKEIRLNRWLTTNVYEQVVPMTQIDDSFILDTFVSDARIQHLESIKGSYERFSEDERKIRSDCNLRIKDSFLHSMTDAFNYFFRSNVSSV